MDRDESTTGTVFENRNTMRVVYNSDGTIENICLSYNPSHDGSDYYRRKIAEIENAAGRPGSPDFNRKLYNEMESDLFKYLSARSPSEIENIVKTAKELGINL